MSDPVCTHCDDTHLFPVSGFMCTYCPVPCRSCATSGGRGAFCATTPCPCACHGARPAEVAILRVPLSEVEAHRKELTDARAVIAAAQRAVYDAAYCDDVKAPLLRQSIAYLPGADLGHQDRDIDVAASVAAFADKAKALAEQLNDRACKLQEWQNAHAELLAQWKEQCEQTRHFASENIKAREQLRALTGAAVEPTAMKVAEKLAHAGSFVAIRRDASGLRFWWGAGTKWKAEHAGAVIFGGPDREKNKPRGSKLVAVDDVPALLAADAAKPTKEKPTAPTKPTPVRVQVSPSAQGFSTGTYVVRRQTSGLGDVWLDEDDTGVVFSVDVRCAHHFNTAMEASQAAAQLTLSSLYDGSTFFVDRIAPEVTDV